MNAENRTAAPAAAIRYAALTIVFIAATVVLPCSASAQGITPQLDSSQSKLELIRKINDPISNVLSLPVETNILFVPEPQQTVDYIWNVRPAIPISFGSEWRIISHLDVPVVYRQQPSGAHSVGLSDTELTLFFTSKEPHPNFRWGFGPLWRLPTATNKDLGPRRWGTGPAAVVVRETDQWTFGVLGHQVWSFAGVGTTGVNATFINPWMSYAWKSGLSLRAETESTYDWTTSQWTAPVEAGFSKLLPMGKQAINVGGNILYFVERGSNDARWGMRFTANFVLRK